MAAPVIVVLGAKRTVWESLAASVITSCVKANWVPSAGALLPEKFGEDPVADGAGVAGAIGCVGVPA